ncbi:MAG: D-Ala-D-Ala carboxypeptidase family metallohydrolase [Firmicutes bacterium]|nr:D-Ala-D-Ala carboxypeptidase family metallohydrolase [Bacillota bacterium]
MAIQIYSKRADGAKQLSPNFRVAEMACKDGSDKIMIDIDLVMILQRIRDWAKAPINVNSGYRTAAHNAQVGGSPGSRHLQGMAADIVVTGKTPLEVAQYAESLYVGGIGLAPAGQGNFVHIDTRKVTSRWEYYNDGKSTLAVSGFGGVTSPPMGIEITPKSMMINGQTRTVRAGLVESENYVHLRDLVAALGGVVAYDEATRQISIITQ